MKSGDISDLLFLLVDEDRQQRAATVLVDVAYVVEARFEITAKAGPGDNEGKHLDLFNRHARKGQCFQQPCLGTREFPARFRLIEAGQQPCRRAIDETRDLGFMLYDIDHGGVIGVSAILSRPAGHWRHARAGPGSAGDLAMSALASLGVRAYERLPNAPAFGYSTERIGFLVSLNADGSPAGPPIDLREGEGKRKAPRLMQVPASFQGGRAPHATFILSLGQYRVRSWRFG